MIRRNGRPDPNQELQSRIQDLQQRLDEAEETLRALRSGEIDAIVTSGLAGDRVYTLKGADEAYRIMVQNMAEGALTVSRDGLVLFSNGQFASMLGIPLERVIGSQIQDFIRADDAPLVSGLLNGCGETKAELGLRRAPDLLVPAQISANTLLLDGIECVCLIVTDLTAQKRNQEIVSAERLARSILDQTAAAILVVDPAGRIIRASRAAEKMGSDAVLLRRFDDVFRLRAASDPKEYTLDAILSMVEQGGSVAGLDASLTTPNGRAIDVLVSASFLTGAKSERLGSIILLSDVSGLKRAEEEVRQLSEQRGLALEAGQLGAWDYRFQTGEVFLDERCRTLFGIQSLDQIQYNDVISKIHSPDREGNDAAVQLAINGADGGAYYREFRVVLPDGSLHWVASRGQAYFQGHGQQRRALRFVGVAMDITERKDAEESRQRTFQALETAAREKTVLLQEIHHRVKNNLAVIASLLNMTAQTTASEEARSALADSYERVHAIALVHQHLYGSSHLDRIDFSDYARELAQGVYSTLASESGRVNLVMDLDPIEIGIDRAVPCGLILNELVTNAFKYAFPSPRHGTIRISFHNPGAGMLELSVADDGIGLAPGHLTGSSEKSLGLKIVRVLTKQLGGALEQKAAQGTHVVLRFPAASNTLAS